MQEPIISEKLFDRVQELRSHKRRNTKPGRASLIAGLLFCPDFGVKLHFCAAKILNHNQEFYRCANYEKEQRELLEPVADGKKNLSDAEQTKI